MILENVTILKRAAFLLLSKDGRCLSSTLITLDVHTWVRRRSLGPETTRIFKLIIDYGPGIARYLIGWSSARAPLRSTRRGGIKLTY